jgi:hypothetical protein
LAGFEITERRGLVKSIFWNFLARLRVTRQKKGRKGRPIRLEIMPTAAFRASPA